MTSYQELKLNSRNKYDDKLPQSSSRMLLQNLAEDTRKEEEKKQKAKNKEKDVFIIEKEFLALDECTSMNLVPVSINQKCYICKYCTASRHNYICKFCYDKCHQKCRDAAKVEPKEEEFRGEREFACFCGYKLKHQPEESLKRELKMCDLLVLDKSLEIGLFYCQDHQLPICCVCSVECHKNCRIRKEKDNNPNEEHQCSCMNEKHTTYNELA